MEINPRVVFERLFGDGAATPEERRARMRAEHAASSTRSARASRDLQRGLGARDRAELTEYLDNVREIERRIQQAEKQRPTRSSTCRPTPVGVPESFDEHVKLMFDLMALAYQADLTRVFTFMMARELSTRPIRRSASPTAHHRCRINSNEPEQLAKHGQDQHLSRRRCSPTSSSSCGRRRTATAPCSITR